VIYLLDTNIVSYFLQAGRESDLAAAAKSCSMALVDEVRRELENDKVRGGRAFQKWLATSNIEVRPLVVGSPASTTLAHLLNPASPGKGRGERASIALAAHDASLTLVSYDKNGLWLALRELWVPGERILGVEVFLRRLFEQGALKDPAILDEVISNACAGAKRPTWWAPWRVGLAPDSTSDRSPPAPAAPAAPKVLIVQPGGAAPPPAPSASSAPEA